MRTEEHRKNLSLAKVGKKQSEAQNLAIKEGAKKIWADRKMRIALANKVLAAKEKYDNGLITSLEFMQIVFE